MKPKNSPNSTHTPKQPGNLFTVLFIILILICLAAGVFLLWVLTRAVICVILFLIGGVFYGG